MLVELERTGGRLGSALEVDVEEPPEYPGGGVALAPAVGETEALRTVGPAQLVGRLMYTGPCWALVGQVTAAVTLRCDRCAGAFEQALEASVTHVYCPDSERDPQGTDGAQEEASEEDEEITRIRGDEVDLWPAAREALLLALPMKTLCRPDCRGLCPQCGQNLNEGVCDCDPHTPDPRMAKLAALLKHDDKD